MNVKRNLIVLLACLATQIALGEPSLTEENAAENAAIKKEWESWDAPRIRESVTILGSRPAGIKIILNSHAHTDHASGYDVVVPSAMPPGI